jgi:hypothetical protein
MSYDSRFIERKIRMIYKLQKKYFFYILILSLFISCSSINLNENLNSNFHYVFISSLFWFSLLLYLVHYLYILHIKEIDNFIEIKTKFNTIIFLNFILSIAIYTYFLILGIINRSHQINLLIAPIILLGICNNLSIYYTILIGDNYLILGFNKISITSIANFEVTITGNNKQLAILKLYTKNKELFVLKRNIKQINSLVDILNKFNI